MVKKNGGIDAHRLKRMPRKLNQGMIELTYSDVGTELAVNHAADPIKDVEVILEITDYLKANKRYRDNMLFIIGINFGLRASDLRNLRFCDLINQDLTFKDTFPVFEQKTRNTRKHKKNRYITVNDAVIDAVTLYLEHTPNVSLGDYLFKSQSGRGKNGESPLAVYSIDRILKGIAKDLGLCMNMSTHTLRKTFCYHQMAMDGNSQRKLLLLQKMLGHSSPSQTLDYIGITSEEMADAYLQLNLGSKKAYFDSEVFVEDSAPNDVAGLAA